MLSARLVRMVEEHAEELTQGLLKHVQEHPRLAAYRHVSADEVRRRTNEVYSHLGRWLTNRSEEAIADTFGGWGRRRHADGVPASELVLALQMTKRHLEKYILGSGLGSSAVELYQEEELHVLVDHFFDKAIYWVVRGYEDLASAGG
jgi:hypothetical protein